MDLNIRRILKILILKLFEGIVIYLSILCFEAISTKGIPPFYNGRTITAIPIIILNSYLYKNRNFYYIFLFSLSLLIGSVILIKHITEVFISPIAFDLLLGFTLSVTNIVLLITASCKQNWGTKFLGFIILILTFLPILFIWSYFFISHAYINVDTILALLQTNLTEVKEYIHTFASWKSSICSLIFLLCLITIFSSLQKKLNIKCLSKPMIILVILTLISNCWLMYRCRINIISGPFFEAKKFISLYERFNKNKVYRKENITIDSVPAKGLYVLIIGESHSKNHTSAYGYKENTSPWLNNIKDSDTTLLFTNAYSNHVQTVPTVTYALTAKNQYNTLKLEDSISLFEAVEIAGFDTAWISNQFKFAVHDTPITIIADEANQQIWLNENKVKGETQDYDGNIITKLRNIEYKENILLVIHLMGSHAAYSERYPKEFKHFQPENPYNDSLRYNDYVVKNIYQELRKQPNFKAMIYFSDHGEIPNVGHDTNNYNKAMTDIPFYACFSADYIEENPTIFNNLKNAQHKPFTNDLIFNTMLGIMNIKIRNVYESNNDFTDTAYDDNKNRFLTLHGKSKLF